MDLYRLFSLVVFPDTFKISQLVLNIKLYFVIDEPALNLVTMPESNMLKKETSVINSPSNNKQFLKTEAADKKV